MSHHATRTARGPAAVTTVCVLAALVLGAACGLTAGLYVLTDDLATTARVIVLAAAVVGGAADLIWMARSARGLLHLYRGQR
jgi:hypothetical protein